MKKDRELQERENKYKRSIGNKIKVARANQKCTQEKLAEKINRSTRYVSQLERGIAFGSADTIINLCKALTINADFLFQDLIDSNLSSLSSDINPDFAGNYMQLTNEHKEVLHRLASELIKMQDQK